MKLSELSTDELLDKICDLTPHISKLVADKEIKKILSDKVKVTEENKEKALEQGVNKGLENLLKLVPVIFKKNRKTVYEILSIMNDTDVEKIKNQSIKETIRQLNEILRDEEFKSLFTSLMS